jgi:hypothetical protein
MSGAYSAVEPSDSGLVPDPPSPAQLFDAPLTNPLRMTLGRNQHALPPVRDEESSMPSPITQPQQHRQVQVAGGLDRSPSPTSSPGSHTRSELSPWQLLRPLPLLVLSCGLAAWSAANAVIGLGGLGGHGCAALSGLLLWTSVCAAAALPALHVLAHARRQEQRRALALAAAAEIADDMSSRCGVEVPVADNPAKQLGLQFAESLPMIWGTGEVGPVASYRAISQLAENAKMPAIHGEIPESQHNQVVVFDGPFAGGATIDDLFRDRDEEAPRSFRLVVLRDGVEYPQMARRAEIVEEIARRRNVPVTEVAAEGVHIVHRLASLITLTDWASVYAAIALHIDPTPIGPIAELKARLADPADHP